MRGVAVLVVLIAAPAWAQVNSSVPRADVAEQWLTIITATTPSLPVPQWAETWGQAEADAKRAALIQQAQAYWQDGPLGNYSYGLMRIRHAGTDTTGGRTVPSSWMHLSPETHPPVGTVLNNGLVVGPYVEPTTCAQVNAMVRVRVLYQGWTINPFTNGLGRLVVLPPMGCGVSTPSVLTNGGYGWLHELGHMFNDLSEGQGFYCSASECHTEDYRDAFGVMGGFNMGQPGLAENVKRGFLVAPSQVTAIKRWTYELVTQSGTYVVPRIDSMTPGSKGLRIQTPTISRDIITRRWPYEANFLQVYVGEAMMDLDQETTGVRTHLWLLGESFTDRLTGLTVTLIGRTDADLVVSISIPGSTGSKKPARPVRARVEASL